MSDAALRALEHSLGYTFKSPDLLIQALTHPSFTAETPGNPSYERLEFLGDSVLALVISEWLYTEYSEACEGKLTTARSAFTSHDGLVSRAKHLQLENVIRRSSGERVVRDSMLENALESILGAIFLESGLSAAADCIHKIYGPLPESIDTLLCALNPKGQLQEHCQAQGFAPEYRLLGTAGPDHSKHYTVGVYLKEKLVAEGQGPSKKRAEEAAASGALTFIQSPQ